MAKSVEEQRSEFNAGIVAVHGAFADFENGFALLLMTLLQVDGDVASAIYFSPNSTEARMSLVDATLTASLKFLPDDVRERVAHQCKTLLNQANRCRKTRNAIIHGQVMAISARRGAVLRLTPPLFDTKRYAPKPGQLPGMSADDLAKNSATLSRVTKDIDLFSQIVFQALGVRDTSASREKLALLESRHPTGADR